MMFQLAVRRWLVACLGAESAKSKRLRAGRFIEEAIELAQAGGITKDEAYAMVDHVYSRPIGDIEQEIGGVRITLTALADAHEIDDDNAANRELMRCWDNILKIHERNKTKKSFE